MAPRKGNISVSRLLSYLGCVRPRADESELIGQTGFRRHVFCNEPTKHKNASSPYYYGHNSISTTKYSILTFLPKSIFEQFRRVANFYFLICAIVACTPITPYTPASLIAPLVLVVGVSIIKEGVEDWRRWLGDDEVNKRLVDVHVGGGQFEPREWRSVDVGDVVKVKRDEFFPADLLLLASSYPDGVCYVETMNLDGETNLKLRKALERTQTLAGGEDGEGGSGFGDFEAEILCEDPNPSLYTFVGNLLWQGETSSLTPQQILLRDSMLRNTAFVYGVAIFTGHDTKAMQNATAVPSKRSRIERRMDKLVYMLFGTIVTLSVVGSIVFGVILEQDTPSWWYLMPWDTTIYYDPNNAATSAIIQAVTAIVLYGYLIPISLYVSIEIVKIFQAWFISADLHMYYAATDMPARARTSNLNEELGQVGTILSDKTGTLTCNAMEFLKCSIAGVAYGRGITEVERATALRLGIPLSTLEDYDEEVEREDYDAVSRSMRARATHVKGFALRDDRLTNGHWLRQPNADAIRTFLRILAVCHTVITEVEEEGSEDEAEGKGCIAMSMSLSRSLSRSLSIGGGGGAGVGIGKGRGAHARVTYEAESPDEAAFVETARQLGCELMERKQSSVRVKELVGMEADADADAGEEGEAEAKFEDREYEVLHVLEFTSARKRMSVVVRDPAGRLLVMCKGADSVMFERLASGSGGGGGREHLDATRHHLHRYGEAGLRTLVLAQRELDRQWYEQWARQYEEAVTSLGAEREALIDDAADRLERELVLAGATAVEDKLQDGVPGAIDRLAQAGIRIWVLTGDKLETAINIGFACSLLREGMRQILISLDSPDIHKLEEGGDQVKMKEVCLQRVAEQLDQGVAVVERSMRRSKELAEAQTQAHHHAAQVRGQQEANGGGEGASVSAAENGTVAASGTAAMEVNTAEAHVGLDEEDEGNDNGPTVFALIIDGKSLAFALEGGAEMRARWLALAMQCASVICCRVSPKQKALVTRLVKEGTGSVTLGIGDGANDVGMIQEADIGVGISGVEGQQAVMASDFAIAQFAYLERLLLVHGHWCYKRIAGMVTYFFYKNVTFGLTLFYYNAYAVFSGQVPYDSWAASAYNVFFTSLPVIGYGVLEQDVSARACLMFPALYQQGPRNRLFSWPVILLHVLYGVYGSAVIFWATFAALSPQASNADGKVFELPGVGASLMTAVVVAVNVHIAILTDHWTWITHLLLYLSIFLWLLFLFVFSYFPVSFSTAYYQIFPEVLAPSPLFWVASYLVLPAMAVLPFFALRAALSFLHPSDRQVVQELVRCHADEEAARQVAAAPAVPVGFSAAVSAVSRRIAKADKRRRRRGKA